MRRLGEDEEFVFEAAFRLEAHFMRAIEHPTQHAARAERLGAGVELAKEQQVAGLRRDLAAALGNDAHGGVGIGSVPAGVGDVVVELIVGIPAQHHVAEAEIAVERGLLNLSTCRLLAAQHAIDVVDAHLHMGEATLLG